MKSKSFSLRARAWSCWYALRGIAIFFRQEHNAWIHLLATVAVFVASFVFSLSSNELLVVLLATGMVWVAEIFNTVIERIMDLLSPEKDPRVAFIKDLAAGGVLVTAVIALMAGAIIFIPKLLHL